MKTLLPNKLTSQAEIESFISELYSNNEFFHLDDDAHDIVVNSTGLPLFTSEEADKLNSLLEQAFEVCNIWELPIIDKIISETTAE
jgi:hypothetical protein